jgi:hypothetical protein
MAAAQSTQPGDVAAIELRARQAFARGEYASALPLLQELATDYKSSPDKVGPIQEQINVCRKAIAAASAQPVNSGEPDPAMAPETRVPHPAPKSGETLSLSIKQLGNFEYDPERGGNIPADVKALSGAKLRLSGFMIPMDQAEHISQFALVPSLFACCFGQPPQIQHTIVVTCPKDKSVSYFPDEIAVEGTLKVDEKKEDGFIVSIFEMECSSVKPVAK